MAQIENNLKSSNTGNTVRQSVTFCHDANVLCRVNLFFIFLQSWISQMGVDRLARKDRQPFYNVLVEDGSIRYAADENLVIFC